MKRKNIFGFQSARAPKGKFRHPGLIQTAGQRRMAAFGRRRRDAGPSSGSRPQVDQSLLSALANLGYKKPVAREMAARAQGKDFDARLRSALAMNPKGKQMSKKKKAKKSRKGKMPAGLRKYWAKKRAAKARRHKSANRKPRAKRNSPRRHYAVRRRKTAPRRRNRKSKNKKAGLGAKLAKLIKGNPQHLTKVERRKLAKLGVRVQKYVQTHGTKF